MTKVSESLLFFNGVGVMHGSNAKPVILEATAGYSFERHLLTWIISNCWTAIRWTYIHQGTWERDRLTMLLLD